MSVNFHLIVDLCTPIYLSTPNHNHNHRHQCGSSPVAIHPSIAQGAAAVGWIASEASRVSSSLPPHTRLTPNNKLKKITDNGSKRSDKDLQPAELSRQLYQATYLSVLHTASVMVVGAKLAGLKEPTRLYCSSEHKITARSDFSGIVSS